MPRYFLEVAYKGTNYSGFQSQQNANSVQAEVEKAFTVLHRSPVSMTGSSRTDAGVHALQNYFHFDYSDDLHPQLVYKMNAILPMDIVVNAVTAVEPEAHCRFDALSRHYQYFIYRRKDPFLQDRAYYYPYRLDFALLQDAAKILGEYQDFTSFSKRNTQVKTFICRVIQSEWQEQDKGLVYSVTADRFLRGMVRALTATMLLVGRGRISLVHFRKIIEARDCTLASFAVPPHGLFLTRVSFGAGPQN